MLLDNVTFAPEAQGTGGRPMLKLADQAGVEAGYRPVELCTNWAVTWNLALYVRID